MHVDGRQRRRPQRRHRAAGHDYGVFWFEQGEGGKWTRRQSTVLVSGARLDAGRSEWRRATDFVTGKRFMAHNGNDPGEREPLGVYWFEYRRVAPLLPALRLVSSGSAT